MDTRDKDRSTREGLNYPSNSLGFVAPFRSVANPLPWRFHSEDRGWGRDVVGLFYENPDAHSMQLNHVADQ